MASSETPNVLFIVLDTVRKDHLSVYGSDQSTTPELERVAEEALKFEQAVAPAPWTLPVHASLFTGVYPSEHGATQETPYLTGQTTLANQLSANGYETACYSSNAWITPYTGLTDGFDDQDNFFEIMPGEFLSGPLARFWRTLNDSPMFRSLADRIVETGNAIHERLAEGSGADSKTPQVIDQSIEFMNRHDPYFVFINLMDAHLPYHPPDEYREMFAPEVDPSEVCQNSKEYNSGGRNIDAEEWESLRALYNAEIRHMDAELERLFSWMRSNQEWEDTLVVICSDHGELFGEHNLFGHEFAIYDPLVNVPLLVKHPSMSSTTRTDQVELLDMYHSILDFTGISATEQNGPFDRSRSLFDDSYRSFADSDYAFIEYSRPVVELNQLETKAKKAGRTLDQNSRFYSRMRAARRRDAKLIRNELIPNEFYQLDQDPEELDNCFDESTPAVEECLRALSEFERRVGAEWGPTDTDTDLIDEMDSATQDRLRDLGYIE